MNRIPIISLILSISLMLAAQDKSPLGNCKMVRGMDERFIQFETNQKLTGYEYGLDPDRLQPNSAAGTDIYSYRFLFRNVPIYHATFIELYDTKSGNYISARGTFAFVDPDTNIIPIHSEQEIRMQCEKISTDRHGEHSPTWRVELQLFISPEMIQEAKAKQERAQYDLTWMVKNESHMKFYIRDSDLVLWEVERPAGCSIIDSPYSPVFQLVGTSLYDIVKPIYPEYTVPNQIQTPMDEFQNEPALYVPFSEDNDIESQTSPLSETTSKALTLGRGIGWDNHEKNFPIKKFYYGFDYTAAMRDDTLKIGIFNYSAMPSRALVCGLPTQISTQFFYNVNCALETVPLSEDWLIKNRALSSTNWGSSDKTSVDCANNLWQISAYFQELNPIFTTSYYLSNVKYMILNVPDVAGRYKLVGENSLHLTEGNNISFGNYSNLNWAADFNVLAHEIFHGIYQSSPSRGGTPSKWNLSIEESICDIFSSIAEKQLSAATDRLKIFESVRGSGGSYPFIRNIDKPYLNLPNLPAEPNAYADHFCNRIELTENDFLYKNGSIVTQCYYLLAFGVPHPRSASFPGPIPHPVGENIAARIFIQAALNIAQSGSYDLFEFKQHMLRTLTPDLAQYAPQIEAAWQAVGVFEKPTPWVRATPQTITGPFLAGQRLYLEMRLKDWLPNGGTVGTGASVPGWMRLNLKTSSGKLDIKKNWKSWPYLQGISTIPAIGGSNDIQMISASLQADHIYFIVDIREDCNSFSLSGSYASDPPEQLSNGGPSAQPSGLQEDLVPYKIQNPNRSALSNTPDTLHIVQLSGGSGDADLYIARTEIPSPSDHAYAATGAGNEHQISFAGQSGESFWVSVWGANNFQHPSLSYRTSPCDAANAGFQWAKTSTCFPNPNQMPTNVGNLVRFLNDQCSCNGPT